MKNYIKIITLLLITGVVGISLTHQITSRTHLTWKEVFIKTTSGKAHLVNTSSSTKLQGIPNIDQNANEDTISKFSNFLGNRDIILLYDQLENAELLAKKLRRHYNGNIMYVRSTEN